MTRISLTTATFLIALAMAPSPGQAQSNFQIQRLMSDFNEAESHSRPTATFRMRTQPVRPTGTMQMTTRPTMQLRAGIR